jgi:N6-adenosine-specific RNA methylase IME4
MNEDTVEIITELAAEDRAANWVGGEAKAFIHVAGYTFKLGLKRVEWLLEEDRWRRCGFATSEEFAEAIEFDKALKPAAEARKAIAEKLFAIGVSKRKIAKTLNVSHTQINDDLSGRKFPPDEENASQNKGPENATGNFLPPGLLGGGRAADLISKKAKTYEERRGERDERERALGDKILALPDKRYGVIYADPEWRFEFWSQDGAAWSSPDNHYQTSPLDVIKARPVEEIAADDCALFLWSTVPMQPQAYEVMAAWGFAYKSQFVWIKDKPGNGYWNRNQHEILLLGTRGEVPAPIQGPKSSSVIFAPVGGHSEKPESFYGLIEEIFPTLPKIELNARKRRDGWDAWGLEAPAEAAE